VNQSAQRPFVETETGRIIESHEAGPAGGADTLLIQRKRVEKWSVTDRTEIFRVGRQSRLQTRPADGYPSDFIEGLPADPAVVGEEQRKKSVGNPAEELGSSRQCYLAT
jgi:hypothetical protein